MKSIFAIIALAILSGCSSAPTKKLYKNCENAGGNLFYCEEIPSKEVGGRLNR